VAGVTRPRTAALINFALRTAYGAFMLGDPNRVGQPWLGGVGAAPSTVPLRGIGGREIALHVAGAVAILGGAPTRPWLLASLGGDLTDITATFADRAQLPDGGLRACLLTGGGSALMTAGLIAFADD